MRRVDTFLIFLGLYILLHIVFFNSVIIIVMNYECWNHSSRRLVFLWRYLELWRKHNRLSASHWFFLLVCTPPWLGIDLPSFVVIGSDYAQVHVCKPTTYRDTHSQHWWNFRQRRRCNVRFCFQRWNDVLFMPTTLIL